MAYTVIAASNDPFIHRPLWQSITGKHWPNPLCSVCAHLAPKAYGIYVSRLWFNKRGQCVPGYQVLRTAACKGRAKFVRTFDINAHTTEIDVSKRLALWTPYRVDVFSTKAHFLSSFRQRIIFSKTLRILDLNSTKFFRRYFGLSVKFRNIVQNLCLTRI